MWECSSKWVVDGLITSPVQVPANALLVFLAFPHNGFFVRPRSVHDVFKEDDPRMVQLKICLDGIKCVA